MKIKTITEEGLRLCHENLELILTEVVKTGHKTLEELFAPETICRDTGIEYTSFTFNMNDAKTESDVENIKIVYSALRHLTPSQASQEGIWVAFAFSDGLDYLKKRWQPMTDSELNTHFLYGFGKHRSLFRQGIARLWWIGFMTYDESYEDPYTLTRFTCNHTDIIQFICEQPVFQNQVMRKSTIRAMYDLDRQFNEEEQSKVPIKQRYGIHINKRHIQAVGRYMNMLSASYIIDTWPEEQVYKTVQDFIRRRVCHG